jgi:hypothetical protein
MLNVLRIHHDQTRVAQHISLAANIQFFPKLAISISKEQIILRMSISDLYI